MVACVKGNWVELLADGDVCVLGLGLDSKQMVACVNPLTAISRSSGYKLFVTRCRKPAFRIEHYMQNGAVNRCSG